MSVATPTLLSRPQRFPHLLPRPPHPHPVPVSERRIYRHMNAVRDLQREIEDLSDEENELEEINHAIRSRGYSFMVPIGKSFTQQEEKNDAEDDTNETGSARSAVPPSIGEDEGENESAQDLDASMEDLDEEGSAESEDNEEMESEEYEEDPSGT